MFDRSKSPQGQGSKLDKATLDQHLEQAVQVIQSGDGAAGVGLIEESVERLQASAPDSPLLAHASYNAALANLLAGDGRRAVRWLRTASDIPGRDHESQKDRLTYLMNLGDVLTRMGELSEAEGHLRQGLEERLAFYGSDHPGVAFGLTPLAANLLAQGRAAEALPMIDLAVEINGGAGQSEVAGDLALRAFILKSAQGADGAAFAGWEHWPPDLQSAVLDDILERAQAVDSPAGAELALAVLEELTGQTADHLPLTRRLNVLVTICNTARVTGDHAMRVRFGHRALELAKQTGDPPLLVNMYEGLGLALEDAGQSDEAGKAYRLAHEVAREAGDAKLMANVLRNYGLWCGEKGRHDEAARLLTTAVTTAERAGDALVHGRALAAYGIFLQHRDEFTSAEQALRQCIALLPVAHTDRFCAMSHLLALEKGAPCPCHGEAHGQAASAIVEEIVRRSAPAGLLERISLGGGEGAGVNVQLSRQPTGDEMEQLQRLIELALAEIRKNVSPGKFPA